MGSVGTQLASVRIGMATRAKHPEQSGFTLVELLVVVAIIGILSSVAITQYAGYKQKAVDGKMESDLQSGRHAMEAYFVDNDTYQGSNETTLASTFGFRQSAATTFKILSTAPLTYQIEVCAEGGTSAALLFDSTVGISQQSSSCT
jgi:prepilin-type N-terminal cleavage/methylation domain-containing protein